MKTLSIAFSAENCHAQLLEKNICIEEKLITFNFDNKDKLPSIISELKFLYSKPMCVIVTVPAENCMMQDITITKDLSDTEIILFLKARAAQLFGHSADQLCIDYEIKSSLEKEKQTLFVIAAHASLIAYIQKSFAENKMPLDELHISNQKINLLPWRKKLEKKKKYYLFFRLSAYASAFFILCIFLNLFLLHKTNQLNIESSAIEKSSAQIILNHPKRHLVLLQDLKTLFSQKEITTKSNQNTEKFLLAIADDLPENVTLQSLTLHGKRAELTGFSDQLSSIHQYNTTLQNQFPHKHILLSEIHNDQQNKLLMRFTLMINSV